MFILTQFIGIYIVNYYSSTKTLDGITSNITETNKLPYGMETPEVEEESDYSSFFMSIIFAFIIAITLLFFLTKFNADFIIKLWFFIVITIALGLAINTFTPQYKYASLIALAIAFPLAFIKIYKQNFLVHNLTELLIYPGIAAIFVPILNVPSASCLNKANNVFKGYLYANF